MDGNMGEHFYKELDYKKGIAAHGSYSLSKVIQQTSTNTAAAITGSGVESIFELPPKVYNFARSVLTFTNTPSAVAAVFNMYFADGLPEFRQVQLYTRGGLMLADLQYADNYVNQCLRHETKLESLIDNDPATDGAGYLEGLQQMGYTIANTVPNAGVPAAASLYNNQLVPCLGGTITVPSPDTPVYIIQSLNANVNAAQPVIKRKIPLSIIKNSIFELDKDLYFGGETLYLSIFWKYFIIKYINWSYCRNWIYHFKSCFIHGC